MPSAAFRDERIIGVDHGKVIRRLKFKDAFFERGVSIHGAVAVQVILRDV